MITSLRLDRLGEGQVALYDLPPVTREDAPGVVLVIRTVSGGFAHVDHQTRASRLFIPTYLQLGGGFRARRGRRQLLADVLTHVGALVHQAEQLGWQSATLVHASREPFVVEGSRYVVSGFVLLEGTDAVDDTEPVQDTAHAVGLVREWIAGTEGRDLSTVHPSIRNALARQMAMREEATRRWLEDEPRRVAEAAARQEVTAAITRRARDLLVACLSPSQRAEFEQNETFTVECRGSRYRVRPHHAHNVDRLDHDGVPEVNYCVVTTTWVPLYDQMLAQKLLLETDPDTFFATANFSVVPPRVQPGEAAP